MTTRKCGFSACFTIKHHAATNLLHVLWFWQHNHDPSSHEDMLVSRLPQVVEQWLTEKVVSGLGWRAIKRLLLAPEIFPVCIFPSCSTSSRRRY
jgi:hypothetical protein